MTSMVAESDDKIHLLPKRIIAEFTEDERKAVVEGGVVPGPVLLKLEALGLVKISPRHWWLTHFGDYIKEMIVNKREMTIGEAEAFKAGVEETKALALKAVDDEAELPGDPGPRVMKAIEENPVAALRGTVIATKRGIRERIEKIGL